MEMKDNVPHLISVLIHIEVMKNTGITARLSYNISDIDIKNMSQIILYFPKN